MSLIEFLVASANAPFSVAAGIAVVFFAIQVTGLLGLLAGHGHHDGGGGHDASHDGGFLGAVSTTLGIRRLPLSVVVQAYLATFAVTGLAISACTWDLSAGAPPATSLAWTLPLALAVACGSVAVLARWLGPVLASRNEDATTKADLVGKSAVVISSRVTTDFGEVRMTDRSGHQLRLVCKLMAGSEEVAEGRDVVIVEYERERGEIVVAPLEDQNSEPDTRERGHEWNRR